MHGRAKMLAHRTAGRRVRAPRRFGARVVPGARVESRSILDELRHGGLGAHVEHRERNEEDGDNGQATAQRRRFSVAPEPPRERDLGGIDQQERYASIEVDSRSAPLAPTAFELVEHEIEICGLEYALTYIGREKAGQT